MRRDGAGVGESMAGAALNKVDALGNSVGQILLTPHVTVPAHEAWLMRNPAALSKVREGIAQAGRGEARRSRSFAEFADEDVSDD